MYTLTLTYKYKSLPNRRDWLCEELVVGKSCNDSCGNVTDQMGWRRW